MTDALRFFAVILPALAALAAVCWYAEHEHRMAWERTRDRIAADVQHTADVRRATARRRLQRLLAEYWAAQAPLEFGPQVSANDQTTLSVRRAA